MNATRRQGRRTAAKSRWRVLFRLLLPTLILLPLFALSTFWHRPTRVRLELATARLAFTTSGEEHREILNRSVPFSSLMIEDCLSVIFDAETLAIADPRQLVAGTSAEETPRFPTIAWHELPLKGHVKLLCHDPAAKLALQNFASGAKRPGTLDRIYLAPHSQVTLDISPALEPTFRLEVGTPQNLSLALGPDLEFVTEFIEPEGIVVPYHGAPLTWRARLPEERGILEVTSGRRGFALTVTTPREQLVEIFREPLNLPLASLELLAEELEGRPTSPLRDQGSFSYPDFPSIPPVTVEKGEAVDLGGLSQAQLRSLSFDAEKGVFRLSFDGIVERATSRVGAFSRDHRLTLFHTLRYSWRWSLLAVATAWLASTTWAAFELWRNLG